MKLVVRNIVEGAAFALAFAVLIAVVWLVVSKNARQDDCDVSSVAPTNGWHTLVGTNATERIPE